MAVTNIPKEEWPKIERQACDSKIKEAKENLAGTVLELMAKIKKLPTIVRWFRE